MLSCGRTSSLLILAVGCLVLPSRSVVLSDVEPAGWEFYGEFGCSEADLRPWLSPKHQLPGYHVLCVAPENTSTAAAVRDIMFFREGGWREDLPQSDESAATIAPALPIVLQVTDPSHSWKSFRNELAQDIGVSRHVDPWHDAGKFFQLCRNQDARCQEWAARGECEANPDYMLYSCGGSCGTCNLTVDEPMWRGQPWRLFDAAKGQVPVEEEEEEGADDQGGQTRRRQGTGGAARAGGAAALARGGVFLLFEGGQFIWPGVDIGFERRVVVSSRRAAGDEDGQDTTVAIRTLALRPLVLEIENFLSHEECDHVIAEATPHMAQSKVALMDKDKGRKDADFRTSSTYFMPSQTRQLQRIDDRVASVTRVARQHQEYVQVLRYEDGQHYGSHHDFWDPDFYQADEWLGMSQGGFANRLATVFWYMTDVPRGGETNFPRAHGGPDLPNTQKNCGQRGLSVRPEKGKVIIFYSLKPDGSGDAFSLHSACPVLEGKKWAANKWVWNQAKGFIP